jgi:ABC-type sugar transport system ATPase subunit
MAFLQAQSIGRSFPGVVALDDVTLHLELGKVHVLPGENGAGKSTLVKILTGADQPSQGKILIEGHDPAEQRALFEKIAYVPQELNLFPNMTVAENLFLPFGRAGLGGFTLRRRDMIEQAKAHLARFKIGARPEQLAGSLSVSDQQLLQIARACTNRELKILILDEPTSSLTSTEVERVFQVVEDLRSSDHGIVFISHKMDEIFRIGDEVTVLRNGKHVGHCPLAEIDEGGLLHLMSGEEVRTDQQFQPQTAPGEVLLDVKGMSGPRFDNISFQLRRGEILGFAGLVGAGRSELMQAIFGFLPARGGTVTLAGQPWKLGDTHYSVEHGMVYLSEERKLHGILPNLSLRENIGICLFNETAPAGVIRSKTEDAGVDQIIRDYAIKTSDAEKKIAFLSGGNQQKAIIGRAMRLNPQLLIFDEPTKGIDVRTKTEIYRMMKALAEQGTGIILVSSEMTELIACASRILTMHEGRLSGEFVTQETDKKTLVKAIVSAEEASHVA